MKIIAVIRAPITFKIVISTVAGTAVGNQYRFLG